MPLKLPRRSSKTWRPTSRSWRRMCRHCAVRSTEARPAPIEEEYGHSLEPGVSPSIKSAFSWSCHNLLAWLLVLALAFGSWSFSLMRKWIVKSHPHMRCCVGSKPAGRASSSSASPSDTAVRELLRRCVEQAIVGKRKRPENGSLFGTCPPTST